MQYLMPYSLSVQSYSILYVATRRAGLVIRYMMKVRVRKHYAAASTHKDYGDRYYVTLDERLYFFPLRLLAH